MRIVGTLFVAGLALALTGCAGPERKLGRGLSNFAELARLGEVRRSIEQTVLWDAPSAGIATGFLRGMNRTVTRTAVGFYEVATFPFPPYGPVLAPKHPLYPDPSVRTTTNPWGGLKLTERPPHPDSYRPNLISDALFSTDSSLGFSGGDIAPIIPGSRFRIFDN
jgi:putative exosortase-associated protein (TIGR04073 family)